MRRFWSFVKENANLSPAALRLKYHGRDIDGVDIPLAITQIECRQKYAKKFAETLSATPLFLFPSTLAAEQATSDQLAAYHASLINGGKVVDLTAGLGIDALHLCSKCAELLAIERDKNREEALVYNSHNAANISVMLADCRDFLKEYTGPAFDYAFIDPARRDMEGGRVYALADCQPNVVEMLQSLKSTCKKLIVKASPMLDITQCCKEIPGVTDVIALGTTTECKELVLISDLCDTLTEPRRIHAVTLSPSRHSDFVFLAEEEAAATCEIGIPKEGDYLYEPYPAVMKAGPFSLLAQRYGLKKLHSITHLYVSDIHIADFPGSVMKIKEVLTYESKHLKRIKNKYPVISVTTRNFDKSADELRKKLGVKDGLPLRLFAVTAKNGKLMIIAE